MAFAPDRSSFALVLGAALAGLAACGPAPSDGEAAPVDAAPTAAAAASVAPVVQEDSAAPAVDPGPLPGSLLWAAQGPWRLPAERARDDALGPVAVLELLGLDTAGSVLEGTPGSGDWTALLAPAVAARGGRYVAALLPSSLGEEAGELARSFRARFEDEDLFGRVETVELGPDSPPLAEPGSIEAAFTVDDVATWMALGCADKAFADIYAALAPGGRLGVIAPREPAGRPQDPAAPTGYVQQAYVVRLAEEAGFTLEESSELLANAADSGAHPFGVWTLAPYRLTAPLGAPPDPAFDRSAYDEIGEPDRMTLLFRKP